MHSILTALSEATRVEQIIEHTERARFDLRELIQNIGQAYQQTFVRHRGETRVPEEPCWVEGSPDLIAQLLDKLMDNARDFTAEGGAIAIALERGPRPRVPGGGARRGRRGGGGGRAGARGAWQGRGGRRRGGPPPACSNRWPGAA